MKDEKPDDRLSEVNLPDSTKEEPVVYALRREESRWTLSRRDFLTAAVAAVAASKAADPQVSCGSVYAHSDWVESLAISPDGRLLASASVDKSLKLWKLPEGAHYKTLTGHTTYVSAVATSPDGRLLASGSGSAENTIKLWSLPDGALLKTLAGHTSGVYALAISPDGRLLASGGGRTMELWSLPEGSLLNSCLMDLAASYDTAKAVQYRKDGVTYTLPCGSPIPAGAVCSCNCVPGTARS
jgi:WD40 repeat protein